jgi:hypothetical protein
VTKEKHVHASWDQRQVADASHVVVFAIKKNLGSAEVDHISPALPRCAASA